VGLWWLGGSRSGQGVAGEDLAHGLDYFFFRHRALRLRLLLQMLFAAFFRFRKFGADDQILDRDFAARLFVGALNDDTGRIAPVGIFHLGCKSSGAEIKLGADAGVTQLRHHALVVGDAVLVEHRDHDRPAFGFKIDLAEIFERGEEPRHANRKTGRRNGLAAEARYQPIIAPAAADRAETRRAVLAVG